MKKIVALLTLSLLFGGCVSAPKGVTPVQNFQLENYLGTWYEIARLDHTFERGLEQVSAQYSLRDDGGVRVLNRGFSPENGTWKDAEGKAYFVDTPQTGHLKVSFFGPFYGGYIIFDLDHENYQHAFVSGNTQDYLWLLSRTPQVDEDVRARFIERASALGFATEELIWVEQGRNVKSAGSVD